MSAQLAKQIRARLKAKNLTITNLEKEAGVTMHAVRNIVRGISKKPNAELLHAVAEALGCTVKDLLTPQSALQEDNPRRKEELRQSSYKQPQLLADTIALINVKAQNQKRPFTVQQILTAVEEIYLHSLLKDPTKPDEEFADWFLKLVMA